MKGARKRVPKKALFRGSLPARVAAPGTKTRIVSNPRVMLGKPVIRGTRIPVELMLRKLAEGACERDIRDAYPRIKRADIRAALAYAVKLVAAEKTAPLPRKRARS